MTESESAALRRAMVDAVTADDGVTAWRDALTPWLPALLAVPRHRFIPDTVWVDNPAEDGQPPLLPVHRAEDPSRWLELAYECGHGLAVQVDDEPLGDPGSGGHLPTSSVSGPAVVAIMLAVLDAHPGQRICEIGTGTGYNAALLASRLGAEHVTSIEVDPHMADHAHRVLAETGFGAVRVVNGDGALGYPPGALYERLIATVAVHQIPCPWVAQTRPGGRIVLPWANTYGGGLLSLTVADDGTASGRIVAEAAFMALRAQRDRGAIRPTIEDPDRDDPEQATATTLHPHEVTGPQGARIAIGQRVPGARWIYYPWAEHDPVGVLWIVDPWGSSAKLTHEHPTADQDQFTVTQYGPRRLWDEVETAHRWWVDHGRPGVDRWRFTVTPDGQRIDLE